jgi:hypothetical protein
MSNFTLMVLMICLSGACSRGPTGEESSNDGNDRTALIDAAIAGDLDEVTQVLESNADLEVEDDNGRTALNHAVRAGNVSLAQVLIDAGADVNHKDNTLQSAYLLATSELPEEIGLEILELTFAAGADVVSLDSFRGTGLIRAADRGYVRIVSRLLETDIDIDHVNNLGWTALLEAILLGGGDDAHTEVVAVLVDAGANVNLADGNGVSPLAHARERGFSEMVAILTAVGAEDSP